MSTPIRCLCQPLGREDLETVEELFQGRGDWLSRIQTGVEKIAFIAGNDDGPAGALLLAIYDNPAEDRNPQCHPDQRAWIEHVISRQPGTGRVLVKHALRWLHVSGRETGRANVYIGSCRGSNGFWLRCGFSFLRDELAEAHEALLVMRRGDQDDTVLIQISADQKLLGYKSALGLKYTDADLSEHTDCGLLMGAPLGESLDRELPLDANDFSHEMCRKPASQ